jgi:hypothetical protein
MKNTLLRCAFVAAMAGGVWLMPSAASAGELKLSMQNGRVTILADNVPLQKILQEWARVGQTKIVNAEKLAGPPVTMQLVDALEKDALDILLRSASGYIAAPRPVPMLNAAFYDRVTIMATSRAPAATAGNMMLPTFQRPPQPIDDSDEPINVAMPPPPQGNPAVGQFPGQYPPGMMPPQMQPGAPQQPLTSPRPGAVTPPPMPAGMPNPYQPIVRPTPGAPTLPGGRGGGPGGTQ